MTIRRATRYALVGALFAFAVAYQVRASWQTTMVETNLDFYVPFTLARFTDRVGDRGGSVVGWTDELLAVNGHPLRGVSIYYRELWGLQHLPVSVRDAAWHPLVITVRDADFRVRNMEIQFPHCTCGVPSKAEAAMFWVAPPMFCILLGFTPVLFCTRTIAGWALLLLMLSLSQLRLFPDAYPGFQQTIDPMIWSDWMRVPAVAYRSFIQHAWPAALLMLAGCLYRSRRRTYATTLAVAGLFITYAAAQTVLDVAWSEDYRPFSGVYRFQQEYATEFTILGMVAVVPIAIALNRRFGACVSTLALFTASAFYWTPAPLQPAFSEFAWREPPLHRTDSYIAALFTAGCMMTGLFFIVRSPRRRLRASCFAHRYS